jgi:ABC-type nitrate/sulfonate/bicarbonate transport system substrate-binding protein
MKLLKVALDWTPNINHIGFYVAKELGFYTEEGIELELLNPKDDNYTQTPGKKLELDLADFAIAPFETVISLNNKANKVNAVAIFAILQEDLSSIVSLKSANILSPKDLDGKIYASYQARYEDHIVKQMIKNDQGTGNLTISYPEKLGIWNTLLEGKADATWIFDNWEGIEATDKNIELNKFSLKNYGIPYGYSPVIIAKQEKLTTNKIAYKAFIKATQKGYLHAIAKPNEAISILKNHLTAADKENIDLQKCIEFTAPYFGTEKTCGTMKDTRVNAFVNWLVENNLEDEKILNQALFTNELFD